MEPMWQVVNVTDEVIDAYLTQEEAEHLLTRCLNEGGEYWIQEMS